MKFISANSSVKYVFDLTQEELFNLEANLASIDLENTELISFNIDDTKVTILINNDNVEELEAGTMVIAKMMEYMVAEVLDPKSIEQLMN